MLWLPISRPLVCTAGKSWSIRTLDLGKGGCCAGGGGKLWRAGPHRDLEQHCSTLLTSYIYATGTAWNTRENIVLCCKCMKCQHLTWHMHVSNAASNSLNRWGLEFRMAICLVGGNKKPNRSWLQSHHPNKTLSHTLVKCTVYTWFFCFTISICCLHYDSSYLCQKVQPLTIIYVPIVGRSWERTACNANHFQKQFKRTTGRAASHRALHQLAMVSSSSGNTCSILWNTWDNILHIGLHCLLLTSRL